MKEKVGGRQTVRTVKRRFAQEALYITEANAESGMHEQIARSIKEWHLPIFMSIQSILC